MMGFMTGFCYRMIMNMKNTIRKCLWTVIVRGAIRTYSFCRLKTKW